LEWYPNYKEKKKKAGENGDKSNGDEKSSDDKASEGMLLANDAATAAPSESEDEKEVAKT
jgi:hypothetical protein